MGRPKDALEPYREERPWGGFEQFTHNEPTTVKILRVKAGAQLSYQYHDHRSEFWRVTSGRGYAILNDDRVELAMGDELFIKQGDKHRLGSDDGMEVLEVAFGVFDEDDNHRLEDSYGRSSPR